MTHSKDHDKRHHKPVEETSTCVIHDLLSKGSETTLDDCECSMVCNCPFSCGAA